MAQTAEQRNRSKGSLPALRLASHGASSCAKPFTQEQLRALLESINLNSVFALRDYCLILFLADTALRIS
jgi:hypothetical protein